MPYMFKRNDPGLWVEVEAKSPSALAAALVALSAELTAAAESLIRGDR